MWYMCMHYYYTRLTWTLIIYHHSQHRWFWFLWLLSTTSLDRVSLLNIWFEHQFTRLVPQMGQMFTDPFELVEAGDFRELSAKRCSHVFEPQLHSLVRNIEGISYNSPCHFPFFMLLLLLASSYKNFCPCTSFASFGLSESHTSSSCKS